MKKLNLGNINAGLNSLKAATDNAAQNGRFELIDTALIDFAAKNSYAADDNEESYKELAANIDEVGLLTPLGVIVNGNRYTLFSGERRFRAITTYLHWTKVPCYVFETKSVRKAQLMLHQANASREYTPQRKLQLYEEYRELLEEMKEAGEIKGGMQEHLAKLMGVSERSVRYYKQMYCNRSWSKAVYFRADQVRRMSETELALIRAERSAKDAAKRAKERAVALAEQEAQRKRENLNIYRQKCAAICAAVSKRPTNLKLVFDLETTGLNFAEDEILEAAITTVDGEVLFESRFKPAYTKEWSGAQRVNGISPEDVEDAPGIIDKIGEMAALLQNAETVIAYNGKQFDIPFLERYGIRLRPDAVIDDPMLYGAVVYGELRGEGEDVNYKWKKLAVLADYLGYKGANWHSAAADCIATAYVWRQLQESDMIEKYNENLAKLNEVSEETDTSF